ncbi:MAG: lysylphosphatidylglycerol synthase transmembrane domain-containing protein, partial [Chromatocurvus sp.]
MTLRLVAGLLVSAFFIYLLLRGSELRRVADALVGAALPGIILALFLLAIDYWLRLLRWHWMLRHLASKATLRDCARPFLVSFALNNVLPLRAGDAARVFAFRETLGIPASQLLATVLLERLLDLLTLLLILVLALSLKPVSSWVPVPFFGLPAAGLALGTLAALLFAALGAILMVRCGSFRGDAIEDPLLAPAVGLRSRLRRLLGSFAGTLMHFLNARSLAILGVFSLLVWSFEAAVFAAVAWAVHPDIQGVWLAMAVGNLGTLVPAGPGHVGTFDFFTMAALTARGTLRETAAAFAIILHLVLWL